jgi:ADP-ribosylglycohydrolase
MKCIGAIIGDTIGSIYEFDNVKTKDFELFTPGSCFTDDTILTIAIMKSLLDDEPFEQNLKYFGRRYPRGGFGGMFKQWLLSDDMSAYNSYGNGSAMRVSPVAYVSDDIDTVLDLAKQTAEVTHNHPEGIKGAQATALAILLARLGYSKPEIKLEIETRFGYDLDRTIDAIRPNFKFDETCQGTVPEAIIAFLESTTFEDCVRNAISLSGDSDTIAAIACSVAEAYYKEIPQFMIDETLKRLPDEFKEILERFNVKFVTKES